MSQYKNLVDILPVGKSIIKVKPLPEFERGEDGRFHPIAGSQQVGEIKNGDNAGEKYYKYDTDIKYYDMVASKERSCQVIGWNLRDKLILDTGQVEVNIIDKGDKKVMYINKLESCSGMSDEIPVIEDGENYEEEIRF